MEYKDVRELVRIRHELRTLASHGDRLSAAGLMERMGTLASRDAEESAAVETELQRWRFVFGLEAR
jgi:hypothetical protein